MSFSLIAVKNLNVYQFYIYTCIFDWGTLGSKMRIKKFRFCFEIRYHFAISKNRWYGWHFSFAQKSTYKRPIRMKINKMEVNH